jgi:hypothetical protein
VPERVARGWKHERENGLHKFVSASDIHVRMRSFCIVVQRGHQDLFDALWHAFRSRPGFYVVIDRRNLARQSGRWRGGRDRRGGRSDWGDAHFLIAESVEPFGGSSK